MSDFWKGILVGAAMGFVLGILASMIANYLWDLKARWRAHRAAGKLVGTWVAYNIHGRAIDATPMLGAGLTVVSSRHWWAPDSGLLDVQAQDIDPVTAKTREHSGNIVLDPVKPWLATRILRYADSNEIAEQRLEIEDRNTIYVFPDSNTATLGDVYQRHVWRRAS
jgi:hypothetical protein